MRDKSYQSSKPKPKARRAVQRARRPRKKPQIVIGFSEEARRQLSRQAGLDPEQSLKYGSGIPTIAPDQLAELAKQFQRGARDDGSTITLLEHGVVRADGPVTVWHQTPKPCPNRYSSTHLWSLATTRQDVAGRR